MTKLEKVLADYPYMTEEEAIIMHCPSDFFRIPASKPCKYPNCSFCWSEPYNEEVIRKHEPD